MADLIELDLVVRDKGLKQSLTTVERLERQIVKAAKAVDQNRISQDRYNKVLLQAKREYQALGVSSQKATAEVRRFAEDTRRAQTATMGQTEAIQRQTVALQKNAVAANQTKRGTNQLGVLMQQTGYQVGDFAIQVQSGTNYMVALGQQATQLIGTFAMLAKSTRMIALFSGLGIAVPILTAIGAYFVRAAESSKDATEEVKSFSDAISDSQSAIDRAKSSMDILGSQGLETLRERYGVLTREVKELSEALADIDRRAMTLEVQGAMENLFSPEFLKQVTSELGNVGAAIVETTEEDIAFMRTQLKDFEDQVKNFPHLESNYAQVIKEMREEIAAVTGDLKNMGSLTDELKVPAESLASFKELRETIERATKEENFLEAADGISEMRSLMKSLGIEVDSGVVAKMTILEDKLRQAVATTSDITVEAENLTLALENAARAMSALDGFGLSVQQKLVKMTASNEAIKQGLDGRIAGEIAVLKLQKDRLVNSEALDKQDRDNMAGEITRVDGLISAYEEQLTLNKELTKSTKKTGSTTKDTMTEAQKAAQAYADALDNTVVAAVGGVSDAWADFVMRGFKDFKGFVGAVLGSFKNMIAQMIAIATKNRIMLTLGIGGVAPNAALAATQGGGIMTSMLGAMGTGKGLAGLAGGTGFMGGVGNGLAAFTGGAGAGLGASFGAIGSLATGGATVAAGGAGVAMTLGAAVPAIGALVAGAMVLKKIFGGKKPLFSEAQFEAMADAALLTGQSFRELAADLEDVESGVVTMTRATQAVIKSIADATGGMEEFAKKSQFFFGNFYTESEQQQYLMAKSTAELNKQFAELNVAVPQTHEEYRKLVQAQDLTTESGREMYAALLNASEAFVAVKGSAEAAAAAQGATAEQTSAFNARILSREVSAFQEEQQSLRNIEEVGTTVAQNEYLLDQFVEDYNKYVDDFNSDKDQYQAQLSKIDRNQLEELTTLDDDLQKALEATSGVQASILEWYTGIKKTNDDIINMIKESIEEGTGATTADLKAFKQQGEFTQNFADVFGKYGMFEQLPYYLELIMYTKDRIREIRGFKSAAVDVMKSFGDYNEAFSVVPDAMMDLNDSLTGMAPEIKNAANLMGQIAFNFASAFDALTLGYGKISEAIGKVNTFYKEQFSALAAEYNVQDVATQSIDISARMGAIIEAPAKLIQTIEDSKARLDRELNKLNKVAGQLKSRMYHLTQNGIEVSGELAASYDEISAAATKANAAAKKAKKELEALQLYVSTMTQAVTDFQDSVEKMLVQDIEDGVKFFEPSLLSDLSGNTKVLVANILKSITEGGYEAFEEGFVRLSDMFSSNSLTVDQFNQSFGLLKDVFEGNISLTDEYTQKQASVVEKLSNAYDNLTSSLEDMLSVVSRGIGSLVGQTASANVVATRLGSLSYLSSVASDGQAEAGSLERAVSSVTSIGATDFSTRQDFMRYVADTTQLLRSVEGTLQGQVDTLEMRQVEAILGIQDTNESAATSLQSIQSLLAEFLGVGGRIPQFASGGYHSGGLRIVGENGPELEATGPSRIIPNNKISVGGDSELRREVAEMRTDLKTALVQIAKNTRKSSDTLNKFDYQGLPDSRGY